MKNVKKILSMLMVTLMLLSAWVFVVPEKADALGTVSGGHSQTHVVPDYQSTYAGYAFLSEYSVPLDGSNGNPDLCVPGLSSTDDYVPQGMTYCEALDRIFISAYPRTGSASSVIYALDFSTGDFVAQFNLYRDASTPLSEHVSGIACSENNLYIADHGSTMSYIPLSELNVATGTVKNVAVSGTVNLSGELNGANTSYASFADGVLWTGNFYLSTNSSYNTMANSASGTIMLGYQISGASSAAEWSAFSSLVGSPSYVIPLSNYNIDIVQCATVADGTVYVGTSWGRKNDSNLYVADLSSSGSIAMTVNGHSYQGYALSKVKKYRHLPMTEGLFVKDGYMYNVFESAAWQYNGYESNNVCPYPTDVVWKFSTGDLNEGEGEVTGYVTIDPIIYTHGTYTGTNMSNNSRKGQMYDYMMRGDTIADGTVSGECETKCSVSVKTVASITVLETGAELTISNGKLTGSMGSDYNNPGSGATATLKFTFTDNTFECHKLAVMTNPVATHAGVGAFNWRTSWFTTRRSYSCYLVTAVGSYGSTPGGSYSYDSGDIKNKSESRANYAYMYDPYDPNGDIDAWDDDNRLKLDSMTDDAGSFDKTAGYYATVQWNCNSERNVTANSPTASYYLDVSSNNNYGIVNNGSSYTIKMLVGGIRISSIASSSYDSQSASRTSESVSVSSGSSTMSIKTHAPSDVYFAQQQCGYAELQGTASVGTTNAVYSTKYTGSHGDVGNSVGIINTNIQLIVSDKSNLRTVFNSYTSEKLISNCYEKTSWDSYIAAMLNAEAFLNNTLTSTSTRDSLKSSLENAHAALVLKDNFDGHPYKHISKISATDPSYYDDGYGVFECSKCGKTWEREPIPSLQTLIDLDDKAFEDVENSGKIALAPRKESDINYQIVGFKSSGNHTLYKSANNLGATDTLKIDGVRISKVSGDTSKIAYKFTKMNFSNLPVFYALVKVTGTQNHKYTDSEIYTWQQISIVPAKNIFFDDTAEAISYSNSGLANSTGYGIWSRINDEKSTITDVTDGLGDLTTAQNDTENSVKYSFGDAHQVSVSNTLGTDWPTAQFTFTGSGFDVISVTDSNSGIFGVKVYQGTDTNVEKPYKSKIVDTYYGYTYTQLFYNQRTHKIVNSTDSNGTVLYAALSDTPDASRVYGGIGTYFYTMNEQYAVKDSQNNPVVAYGWLKSTSSDTLYQVPCLNMDLGEVGTYTVIIQPMFTDALGHYNQSGDVKYYNFTFDGVRIYNPADGNNDACNVYVTNNERYASYRLIKDEANNVSSIVIDGKTLLNKDEMDSYLAGAPKNELYLMPNGTAAFDVNFTDLTDARLGLKAANGNACNVTIAKVVGNNITPLTAQPITINSATEKYVSLKSLLTSGSTTTITVTNAGSGILSLTKLMVTSNSPIPDDEDEDEGAKGILSVSDSTAPKALAVARMLNADIAIDEETVETASGDDGTVTITLRTGEDAETIVIRDSDGNVVDPDSIDFTIDETGVKNWTIILTEEAEGEFTYTLQAEYENGYTGEAEPMTVNVTVSFSTTDDPSTDEPTTDDPATDNQSDDGSNPAGLSVIKGVFAKLIDFIKRIIAIFR